MTLVRRMRTDCDPANFVSIVVPCRNEENFITACLESVLQFERPDGVDFEVLLLDGRSQDRTVELAQLIAQRDARIRIIDNPGLIQSTALNLGIRHARGAWILRLDAHAHYPADYLLRCYETALRTKADNCGGICISLVRGDGYQAEVVRALTTHKFGVGDSGFRTGAAEGARDTVPFGFFRREVFDRIGIFDERLLRCQDYEFNRRLRAAGGVIWLNPAIRCHYYNQNTLRGFYRKQAVLEAPYNPYMWYLAPYSFAWRHGITGLFAAGVLGGALLSPVFPRLVGLPYAGILGLYLLLAMLSAAQQAVRYRQPWHVLTLPLAFFLYHFLHGIGIWVGIARLLFRAAPGQRLAEPWPGAGCTRIIPGRPPPWSNSSPFPS